MALGIMGCLTASLGSTYWVLETNHLLLPLPRSDYLQHLQLSYNNCHMCPETCADTVRKVLHVLRWVSSGSEDQEWNPGRWAGGHFEAKI